MELSIYKNTVRLTIVLDDIKPYLDKYKPNVPLSFIKDKQKRDGDKYHMTIVSPPELKKVDKSVLKTLLETTKEQHFQYLILGHGVQKESHYLVCHYPYGDVIRQKLGLSIFDFHITLGFNKQDIHGVSKGIKTLIEYTNIENLLNFKTPIKRNGFTY